MFNQDIILNYNKFRLKDAGKLALLYNQFEICQIPKINISRRQLDWFQGGGSERRNRFWGLQKNLMLIASVVASCVFWRWKLCTTDCWRCCGCSVTAWSSHKHELVSVCQPWSWCVCQWRWLSEHPKHWLTTCTFSDVEIGSNFTEAAHSHTVILWDV